MQQKDTMSLTTWYKNLPDHGPLSHYADLFGAIVSNPMNEKKKGQWFRTGDLILSPSFRKLVWSKPVRHLLEPWAKQYKGPMGYRDGPERENWNHRNAWRVAHSEQEAENLRAIRFLNNQLGVQGMMDLVYRGRPRRRNRHPRYPRGWYINRNPAHYQRRGISYRRFLERRRRYTRNLRI